MYPVGIVTAATAAICWRPSRTSSAPDESAGSIRMRSAT